MISEHRDLFFTVPKIGLFFLQLIIIEGGWIIQLES